MAAAAETACSRISLHGPVTYPSVNKYPRRQLICKTTTIMGHIHVVLIVGFQPGAVVLESSLAHMPLMITKDLRSKRARRYRQDRTRERPRCRQVVRSNAFAPSHIYEKKA